MATDTIFALSSGSPPAAISVVRLSGRQAHSAAEALAGQLPAARRAALRKLRSADGEVLDDALVLRFDGPASSTGEDLVEFHCHGGRAVVAAVIDALGKIDGLRQAQPGEFTRRAFENGRIDLTEAEGLADLIEAETESQRRAALMMAEGILRKRVGAWQERLLELSARAEAAIDYVDEDSADTEAPLNRDCGALAKELASWLEVPRAECLKDGVRVVIAGPPNAGKSSLLNAMAGFERAIVTDVPGTTRDHIDVPLALSGLPIRLTDTAGLRESGERVERLGIERSRALAGTADVLLWLGDPDESPKHPRLIPVHAKCDLPERASAPQGSVAVSAKSGEGLRGLVAQIVEESRSVLPSDGEIALNARQAACIADVKAALRDAAAAADVVLIAESLRAARAAFDRLTGGLGVEDLLDALFGRFCLGK